MAPPSGSGAGAASDQAPPSGSGSGAASDRAPVSGNPTDLGTGPAPLPDASGLPEFSDSSSASRSAASGASQLLMILLPLAAVAIVVGSMILYKRRRRTSARSDLQFEPSNNRARVAGDSMIIELSRPVSRDGPVMLSKRNDGRLPSQSNVSVEFDRYSSHS